LKAREIVVGLDSPYEKALALQNFFLSEFTYSLDVDRGHGSNRMELFLFEEKAGYCEQFAGTYAAMARSVGLPTRVAVGFTPGERVGDEFIVRGENYHAWPEVYIDGQWVYFEPTPGRGAPGAQAYTGVAEQQADANDPNGATTTTTTSPLDTTTSLPSSGDGIPNLDDFQDFGSGGGGGVAVDAPNPWPGRIWLALLLIVGLGVIWAISVPLLRRLVRRRRRRRAKNNPQRVEAAWTDLVESFDVAGVPSDISETPREYARRAATQARVDQQMLRSVAGIVDVARYSDDTLDDSIAREAERLVSVLEEDLAHRASRGERVKRELDPRPLRHLIGDGP
jgi:hypothetical protein